MESAFDLPPFMAISETEVVLKNKITRENSGKITPENLIKQWNNREENTDNEDEKEFMPKSERKEVSIGLF